jgi:pimeloyl-ACP methyl ester carboxylesterase
MLRSFPSGRRAWKWIVLPAAIAVVLFCYPKCVQVYQAARLLANIRSLALGDPGRGRPVAEEVVRRRMNGQSVEAILYGPLRFPPRSAIVLSPGISELGCRHPQLVALSRALADNGFLVLTPDLQKFRELQISAQPLEEMIFWFQEIPSLNPGNKAVPAGLAGISFSGTLALMAAARPEIRDSVSFVLGIGSYCNLLDMTRAWFAPKGPGEDGPYYPTRYYARWLIMGAALDILPAETDRRILQTVLYGLLKQNQAPALDPGLSPEGQRWYNLAVDGHQSDSALFEKIENHLRPHLFDKLDPTSAASVVRCPVFLIHGAYDDLIPPDQSRKLKERLDRTKSRLLITPFLTHTHAPDLTLSWQQKLSAIWQGLAFLYDFAGVAR